MDSIYIVTLIVLIVWAGIFFFLTSLERRIRELEKEMKEK